MPTRIGVPRRCCSASRSSAWVGAPIGDGGGRGDRGDRRRRGLVPRLRGGGAQKGRLRGGGARSRCIRARARLRCRERRWRCLEPAYTIASWSEQTMAIPAAVGFRAGPRRGVTAGGPLGTHGGRRRPRLWHRLAYLHARGVGARAAAGRRARVTPPACAPLGWMSAALPASSCAATRRRHCAGDGAHPRVTPRRRRAARRHRRVQLAGPSRRVVGHRGPARRPRPPLGPIAMHSSAASTPWRSRGPHIVWILANEAVDDTTAAASTTHCSRIRWLLPNGCECLSETGYQRLDPDLEAGEPHGEVRHARIVRKTERLHCQHRSGRPGVRSASCTLPSRPFAVRSAAGWCAPLPAGKARFSSTTASTAFPPPAVRSSMPRRRRSSASRLTGHGFRNLGHYRQRLLLHSGAVTWHEISPRRGSRRPLPKSRRSLTIILTGLKS